jgi:putative membrane protein
MVVYVTMLNSQVMTNRATEMPQTRVLDDCTNAGRGFLMGAADIIPGVSGGTVALILGIYSRLVTAISRFDLEFVRLIRHREFSTAAAHVNLRFLVTLAVGIATGIVGLSSLMHYLLTTPDARPLTLAAFFGLILASGVLVGKRVERWTALSVVLLGAAAYLAYYVTGLKSLSPTDPSGAYIFLCGMIGICAMILPGISGAFILLLLGMYLHVTGAIKALKGIFSGGFTGDHLFTIAVFSAGCAVGLLTFSKVLRWLLARHESLTMAVLCGFMLGSLKKIWPFQIDTKPQEEFTMKVFKYVWPAEYDMQFALVVLIAIAAMAGVFALDWWSRGSSRLANLLGRVDN